MFLKTSPNCAHHFRQFSLVEFSVFASGELSRQLNDSQAKALIVEKKLIQTAEAALQNSPSVKVRVLNTCVGPYQSSDISTKSGNAVSHS